MNSMFTLWMNDDDVSLMTIVKNLDYNNKLNTGYFVSWHFYVKTEQLNNWTYCQSLIIDWP